MPVINATKTGNWSDSTVWPGGVFPTAGDQVHANSFTITIDQNITVERISTEAGSGGVAGGRFQPNAGVVINAHVYAGGSVALYISLLTGTSAVVVNGNVYGSNATISAAGIHLLSGASLTLVGNITGGNANSAFGLIAGSTGAIHITGNALGGGFSSTYGINVSGAGSIVLNGNSTGGSTSNAHGIHVSAAANVTVNGNVLGAVAGGSGVNAATGITVANNSAVVTVNGEAIPSEGAEGAKNTSRGTLTVQKAKGAQVTYLNTTTQVAGVNATDPDGITLVKSMEFGPNGQAPTSGYVLYDNAASISIKVTRENNSTLTLVDVSAIAGELPLPADVRSGVGYNSNAKVGTMAVPVVGDVRKGVLTDVSGVGEALITAEDMWNFPLADCDAAGSIGERLAKAVSADLVGAMIQALSTKLPA